MKRKNLPSTKDAVQFINACAGTELVRKYYCSDVHPASIAFTIPSKIVEDPLSFALQCFWKTLGEQTHLRRPYPGSGPVVVYEWEFPDRRRLTLLLTSDNKTVVSLIDDQAMIAHHAALERASN
jgi:hypothetical protein